jgi:hypothetical protein
MSVSLVVVGNSAQMDDAAFVRELTAWLRFSPRQAIEAGDGLFSASSGNPALPTWLALLMFDLVFKAAHGEDTRAASRYTSAVVSIDPDPAHLLQSGGVHIRHT